MVNKNTAAYLTSAGAPLEIKNIDIPTPGANDIVVDSQSIALNPVDYWITLKGAEAFPWVTYPSIIGQDVAGTVTSVGSAVTRFKVGDRVLGFSEQAFQKFPVVHDHMATLLPESLGFEKASVVPLCFGTALVAMFSKKYLALEQPSASGKANRTGQAILIWGGSTSVGCNAVQLAVAAGYEVYTTASPHNFDYLKSLGASHVFDYNSPTIEKDLIAALDGKSMPGALAINGINHELYQGIVDTCAAVVKAPGIKSRKYIAMVSNPPEKLPEGVETEFAMSMDVYSDKELGNAIFGNYLTQALANGSFKPAPEPEVVGKGIESIDGSLQKLAAGVSAKKLIVTL